MAAQPGNKYAETLTKEYALNVALQSIEVINEDCYLISTVADKIGIYREKYAYLLNKFNDDPEVFNALKTIYNKCESIVAEKAAKNEINTTFAIFIMKVYHGLIESSKLNLADADGERLEPPKIEFK